MNRLTRPVLSRRAPENFHSRLSLYLSPRTTQQTISSLGLLGNSQFQRTVSQRIFNKSVVSVNNLVLSLYSLVSNRGSSLLSLNSQQKNLSQPDIICHSIIREFHLLSVVQDKSSGDKSAMSSNYVVGHDKQKNYFYIQLKDAKSCTKDQNDLAVLDYSWLRGDLVDLHHTEVPSEFRGQGIAKILAKTALDYFCEKDIKFRPTCTYIQKFLEDNPMARYKYHVDVNSV